MWVHTQPGVLKGPAQQQRLSERRFWSLGTVFVTAQHGCLSESGSWVREAGGELSGTVKNRSAAHLKKPNC